MPNKKLDISVEAVLLSLFPPGTRVIESQSYRPDYVSYPMCLRLQTPGNDTRRCVVKIKSPDLIEREVKALRLLSRLALLSRKCFSTRFPCRLRSAHWLF